MGIQPKLSSDCIQKQATNQSRNKTPDPSAYIQRARFIKRNGNIILELKNPNQSQNYQDLFILNKSGEEQPENGNMGQAAPNQAKELVNNSFAASEKKKVIQSKKWFNRSQSVEKERHNHSLVQAQIQERSHPK